MTPLEDLVERLMDAFTTLEFGNSADVGIAITSLDLAVPLEARMGRDGVVLAALPRGLLSTGFEVPLGRLSLHCGEMST